MSPYLIDLTRYPMAARAIATALRPKKARTPDEDELLAECEKVCDEAGKAKKQR